MEAYIPNWDPVATVATEAVAQRVHAMVSDALVSQGFVASKSTVGTARSLAGDDGAATNQSSFAIDAVGSFLLRSAVTAEPHAAGVANKPMAPFDLVVTMPPSACSVDDIESGKYLLSRRKFLQRLFKKLQSQPWESFLNGAGSAAGADGEAAAAEGSAADVAPAASGKKAGGKRARASVAATNALSQLTHTWKVSEVALDAVRGSRQKEVIRVSLTGTSRDDAEDSGMQGHRSAAPAVVATFFIHARPFTAPGQVASAKAFKKHALYSALLLEDHTMVAQFERLHRAVTADAQLARGIVLLKAWAVHSGLGGAATYNALHGFSIAAMVLYLLETGVLPPGAPIDSVARTLWVQLSRNAFVPTAEAAQPVCSAGTPAPHLNVLFRNTSWFFGEDVRRCAEVALRSPIALDVFHTEPFVPPALRFDVAFVIRGAAPTAAPQQQQPQQLFLAQDPRLEHVAALRAVATQAIGTRTTTIYCDADPESGTALVGVRIRSEVDARSRLVRGPPIENAAEVAAFNAFWGAALTSTRQFADGGVFRCAAFSAPPGDAAAAAGSPPAVSDVLLQILTCAFQSHVAPSCEIRVATAPLVSVLWERVGATMRDAAPVVAPSLRSACVALSTMITEHLGENALPCKVTDFVILSQCERETEVFPPREHFCCLTRSDVASNAGLCERMVTAPCVEPIHCALHIDDRNKIPDVAEAIAKMKAALLAQLGKVLMTRFGHHAVLGTAPDGVTDASALPGVVCFSGPQSLDVVLSGFLFRIYIAHFREVSLLRALQRLPEADGLERRLFWASQHAKFVRTLAKSTPSFALGVRLARRWVAAAMLADFILPELVELLMVFVYQRGDDVAGSSVATNVAGRAGGSGAAPKSGEQAFFYFLQLLATHPWAEAPLVLPFVDAEAAVAAHKESPVDGMMFVATPYAASSSPFTAQTPRPMVVARLVALARAAMATFTHAALLSSSLAPGASVGAASESAWASVFTIDPAAFDIVLHFAPSLLLNPDRVLCLAPSSGEEGGAAAATAVAAGSDSSARMPVPAHCVPSLHPVRRWQLDELITASAFAQQARADGAQATSAALRDAQKYIHQMVEFEPAAQCVRTIRSHCREDCMVFYDAQGPSTVGVTMLSPAPIAGRIKELYRLIQEVVPGAFVANRAQLRLPQQPAFTHARYQARRPVAGGPGARPFAARTSDRFERRREGANNDHKNNGALRHSTARAGAAPAAATEGAARKPFKRERAAEQPKQPEGQRTRAATADDKDGLPAPEKRARREAAPKAPAAVAVGAAPAKKRTGGKGEAATKTAKAEAVAPVATKAPAVSSNDAPNNTKKNGNSKSNGAGASARVQSPATSSNGATKKRSDKKKR